MKKVIFIAVLFACAASSYAFELETLGLSDVKAMEITLPNAVAVAPAAEKQYQNLGMNISYNTSWKEMEAHDYMARIEVRVRKVADNEYSANSTVNTEYVYGTIHKGARKDLQLSGSGISLRMTEWNGGYVISGTVTDGNQSNDINITLHKRPDSLSYLVSDFGINLYMTTNNITGSYEDADYSKKAMAAIVSLTLAAQMENPAR